MSLALTSAPDKASDGPTIDGSPAWQGDEYDLLTKLVQSFEDAEEATYDARQLAERDRDYKDGKQWTPEEAAILRRRRQPLIHNNVIGRKVELLRGLERRGRSDPEAYPRNPVDNVRADAATQALRYISDENRFDVIRSSVYDNMLVEGFGGCEVIVEEQQDGDGYDVVINHIPWERLYYDPHSQHPAFTDAQYLGCVIWMDREDALDMYPGTEDILDATLDRSKADTYDDKPQATWCDYKRKRVRVAQHWWKKRKDWWTATFTKGGFLEAPMLSPYKDRHGNATCPIVLRSAKIDRDNNRFGMVRDMIPLQDEINKRRSKLLHSLSVNQLIFEHGAVDDIDLARSEAAKPDGVIVKNKGFEFEIHKDAAEIQGQFELLQDAYAQMNVAGPNAALAGKDPRDQSGRAIIAQQSGGQVENEPMADALRQWTHKVYEACWMRVRQFWTGPRWVRVTDSDKNTQFVGLNHPVTIASLLQKLDKTLPLPPQLKELPPDDAKAIQFGLSLPPDDPRLQIPFRTENDIGDMDCDITVEEGPDNPTMQAEQFQAILQLPPQILMQFPPEFIIQASSLRNKDELVKMLEEHQKQQAEGQQRVQATQQAMAEAQVSKVAADTADKKAQAVERLHNVAQGHAEMNGLTAGSQPIAPEPPPPPEPIDPLAADDQFHQQQMDKARLGLDAQAQAHAQALAVAQHEHAVEQANKPQPAAKR